MVTTKTTIRQNKQNRKEQNSSPHDTMHHHHHHYQVDPSTPSKLEIEHIEDTAPPPSSSSEGDGGSGNKSRRGHKRRLEEEEVVDRDTKILRREVERMKHSSSSSSSRHQQQQQQQTVMMMTTTKITDLPDSLLCHILLHLPSTDVIRTTRVSRQFRSVVLQDPETKMQLWRDTSMTLLVPQHMDDDTFCAVLDRIGADFVTSIDFGGIWSLLGDRSCDKIADLCSRSLRRLQRFYASGRAIGRLLSACKHLQHVCLMTSKPRPTQQQIQQQEGILQEGNGMVLDDLPSLWSLEIQEAYIGDETIFENCKQLIPSVAPNLRELHIRSRVILPTCIESALRNCKRLRHIDLNAVLIFTVIPMLCASWHDLPYLESISLRGICEISDAEPQSTRPLLSVKRFAIASANFKPSQMDIIAKYFPNVVNLEIGVVEQHVFCEMMYAISKHFKHVKRVVLLTNNPRFHGTPRMVCHYNPTIESIEIMDKEELVEPAIPPPRSNGQPLQRVQDVAPTAPTTSDIVPLPQPLADKKTTFTMQYLEAFMAAFPNLKTIHYNKKLYYHSDWMLDGTDPRFSHEIAFEPLATLFGTVKRLILDAMSREQINSAICEDGMSGLKSAIITILKTKALNEKAALGVDTQLVQTCTLSKFIVHVILDVENEYEERKASQMISNTTQDVFQLLRDYEVLKPYFKACIRACSDRLVHKL